MVALAVEHHGARALRQLVEEAADAAHGHVVDRVALLGRQRRRIATSSCISNASVSGSCNPIRVHPRQHYCYEAYVPLASTVNSVADGMMVQLRGLFYHPVDRRGERMMASGLRKGLTSYGDAGFSLFLRKAFIKAMGFSDDALDRPIIGITNTASDFNPCHGNVPDLIEAAKRGVMLAGGLPMAFPTISIHESFAHPTSMFLRNLMALDTEEMIRAQPMDAVVLIGGCDKTIPAQLMGAASADIPAIVLPTGPMLVGHYKGEVLGACTDCRRLWASYRAGTTSEADIEAVNGRLAPTKGTCMVMGTASTVACMTEALGMTLPGAGTVPATHADRIRAAEASGAAAIRLARDGMTPSRIMTRAAFQNALTVLQAIGGSTNGLIHFTPFRRGSSNKPGSMSSTWADTPRRDRCSVAPTWRSCPARRWSTTPVASPTP